MKNGENAVKWSWRGRWGTVWAWVRSHSEFNGEFVIRNKFPVLLLCASFLVRLVAKVFCVCLSFWTDAPFRNPDFYNGCRGHCVLKCFVSWLKLFCVSDVMCPHTLAQFRCSQKFSKGIVLHNRRTSNLSLQKNWSISLLSSSSFTFPDSSVCSCFCSLGVFPAGRMGGLHWGRIGLLWSAGGGWHCTWAEVGAAGIL